MSATWQRAFAAIPVILLIALYLGWPGFPFTGSDWLADFIVVLPMILLLPGIFLGNRNATGLAGFFALAYLAHGLVESVANPPLRVPAALAVAMSVAVLAGATYGLRLATRHGDSAAPRE